MTVALKWLIYGIASFLLMVASTYVTQLLIEQKLNKKVHLILFILYFIMLVTAEIYSDFFIPQVLFGVFIIITGVIDQLTHSIFVWITIILGMISIVALGFYHHPITAMIIGGALGFGAYLIIYLLAKVIYKREAFGFGDVIFMGLIGAFIGGYDSLIAALLTFYIAVVGILIQLVFKKKLNRKMEVAFAPFMSISAWIVSLFSMELIKLYAELFMSV